MLPDVRELSTMWTDMAHIQGVCHHPDITRFTVGVAFPLPDVTHF